MRDRLFILTLTFILVFLTLLLLIFFPTHAESFVSGDAEKSQELDLTETVEVNEQEQFNQYEVIITKLDNILDFYNKDFSDSLNDIIKNQKKMYGLVEGMDVSGDALSPVVVPVPEEPQEIVESLEDIQTHFFISPEDIISDSKVLIKIYNLLLLIFCFLILNFLYQEAKALFNRLNL